VTSSRFFLSTLNYDAQPTTHKICKNVWFEDSLGVTLKSLVLGAHFFTNNIGLHKEGNLNNAYATA
jgi:hypothetical protein